ncbi:hypothetical protein ABT144_08000 [Streptomyces sp. NPDC002039]|uniref:hypothetical protein n=1 Tax=unclassified Streptomyces TaxID=2593676 RepID=UPI00331E03B9
MVSPSAPDEEAGLPARARAVLWHSVVEEEPDDRVALIAGDRPDRVPDLAQRALAACRDAFLRAHVETGPVPHGPAYARCGSGRGTPNGKK